MRRRHQLLVEGLHGITRHSAPRLFRSVAPEWLDLKRPALAPRSVCIEETNLKRLIPFFGSRLVCDICPEDISQYQTIRSGQGAAPKTVNLEVGTLRAVLRRNKVWASIQPDVRMLQPEAEPIHITLLRRHPLPRLHQRMRALRDVDHVNGLAKPGETYVPVPFKQEGRGPDRLNLHWSVNSIHQK
jgi:hypothetical protein